MDDEWNPIKKMRFPNTYPTTKIFDLYYELGLEVFHVEDNLDWTKTFYLRKKERGKTT